MASKGAIIGVLIIGFILGGILGGFIGYFFPKTQNESFNPKIDGSFSKSEGWENSKWQFIEYLLLDENSTNTNNYIYVHLTENYLYILFDFVGDITGDSEGEWFSVWLDTDNSETLFSLDFDKWNSANLGNGEEMLCYIPETNTLNETLDLMGNQNATLDPSEMQIKHGFQGTINSATPHRIFEMKINRTAFGNFNSTHFNIAFLGYGTAAFPYFTYKYWGATTAFAEWVYENNAIDERRYFKCEP